MTPQDKAKELVNKFTLVGLQQRNEGIACALIAVDEIIYYLEIVIGVDKSDFEFWQQVKHEIEKL